MKFRWLPVLTSLLFLIPGTVNACDFPVSSKDPQILNLLVQTHASTHDPGLLSGDSGDCLDTEFVAREISKGDKTGPFELALESARLEIQIAQALRRIYRDPAAQVYLCPTESTKYAYRVVTGSSVQTVSRKSGRSFREVGDSIEAGFRNISCRLLPNIPIGHDILDIPAGILAYLIIELPQRMDRPFPPEIPADLNGGRIEPLESAAEEKSLPPSM